MTRRRRAVVLLAVASLAGAVMLGGCSGGGSPPQVSTDPPTTLSPFDAAMAQGLDLYGAQCIVCHEAGEESTLAPTIREGLLDVFSSCADQNEFVALGADGWPSDTYGDDGRAFGRYDLVMNGFRNVLTPDEIAAVNLWIRAELAGVDPDVAYADCGLGG